MEWLACPSTAQSMRMRASCARVSKHAMYRCAFLVRHGHCCWTSEKSQVSANGYGLAGDKPSSDAYDAALCACICCSSAKQQGVLCRGHASAGVLGGLIDSLQFANGSKLERTRFEGYGRSFCHVFRQNKETVKMFSWSEWF